MIVPLEGVFRISRILALHDSIRLTVSMLPECLVIYHASLFDRRTQTNQLLPSGRMGGNRNLNRWVSVN